MGFLDELSVVSGGHKHSKDRKHKKRHRSRSRSSSRGRGLSSGLVGAGLSTFFGNDSHYNKHSSSKASFFGGLGGSHHDNRSRSSFFGFSKPSYYKRSSRQGFVQRSIKQLKRLLRDLVHWAKRHPWKVFFLVLMPLITGGALTALLAKFGLRMPAALESLIGVAGKAVTGDSFGLVGEAVRMAGDSFGGGSGSGSGTASFRATSFSTGGGGGGAGGFDYGDAFSTAAKMFK
jgi:hypothetical protein